MKDDKRTIPRHIDGRIMILGIPVKRFFSLLPLWAIIAVIVCLNLSPVSAFIGFTLIFGIGVLASELNNRESGMDILKDIIKYKKRGTIHCERSCNLIDENKRFITNRS